VWEQIASNRRRTAFVIGGMGVLLAAMGLALGGLFTHGEQGGMLVGGAIALAVWLVLWLVSASNGDEILARMARAREIRKQDHPLLVNVVEEMAIASSLGRKPKVYIVDDPAPNAFATGKNPERAAVAVTTGLLGLLDRNELQGVVAHEIGHVKNRDVALMTTAGIMLGSIVLLADLGARAMWYGGARRSRSSNKDGGQAIIMIVALVVVVLAPILAQLLYFALSRRREYLADASGALFTRYPEGLASALEKLGGSRTAQADQSRVTAPMYIVRPLKEGEVRSLSTAFSTHPPLADRIRVLRAMGGGAGLNAYEQAFRKTHGGRGIFHSTPSAAAAEVGARAEAPGSVGLDELDFTEPRERARAASDAFLSASGYLRRTCPRCGAVHKVPPSLAARVTRCTRCQAPLAAE
jgi:heat shock protein HtpX